MTVQDVLAAARDVRATYDHLTRIRAEREQAEAKAAELEKAECVAKEKMGEAKQRLLAISLGTLEGPARHGREFL